MQHRPVILFTAFEPSGDQHAAAVIRELRKRLPETPIHALGGPAMAEAGAELIETTTDRSVMLGGALRQAWAHRRRLRRLKRWLDEHPVAAHVPTDSPAANWAICRMVKRRWGSTDAQRETSNAGLGTVVHLVAPQVWAWARWRVRRLRKWSDLVLCVLPFEPDWFERYGVPARFIGHPAFDAPLNETELDEQAAALPAGEPRIALLPGSREAEVRRNWPVMKATFERLAADRPGLQGVVAAAHRDAAQNLQQAGGLNGRLRIVTGQTDAALRWADAALTVSGTATLHVARHGVPMAIVFAANRWAWRLLGRWLIRTRTFTLPNLLAAGDPDAADPGHIVTEFVPWLGGDPQPIADELASLIGDHDKRARQTEALRRITAPFAEHHAGSEAADAVAELMQRASE